MKDLTYLLPFRIESEDRLKNVITSTTYLLKNFPEAKVILKEVDTRSHFKFRALPIIKKYVNTDQLTHIFEESNEKFFHKTRILNDLLVASDTPIVYNHDVDVVLPKESYELAYSAIKRVNLMQYILLVAESINVVNYSESIFSQFLDSDFDFSTLDEGKFRVASSIGWGQMIKETLRLVGM